MEKEKELKVTKCLSTISFCFSAIALIAFVLSTSLSMQILVVMIAPLVFSLIGLITGIIALFFKNRRKGLTVTAICISAFFFIASCTFTGMIIWAVLQD